MDKTTVFIISVFGTAGLSLLISNIILQIQPPHMSNLEGLTVGVILAVAISLFIQYKYEVHHHNRNY